MNRAIARVGYAVIVLMLLLAAQLTYLQVVDAKRLQDDPRNTRTFLRELTRPRGEILSADGQVLARSVPSGDEYEWQRLYPTGALFSQVVGYQSVLVGSTGVERSYGRELSGRNLGSGLSNIGDLILGKEQTGTVVLSLRSDVQQVARDALGGQRGSVTVLDPSTGSIIAMFSNPTFDPQPLAGHNTKQVQAYYDALNADPSNPALPRAYRERYPPGSTFKVVTTTGALDTGTATPTTEFPTVREIPLPQSDRTIQNFGGKPCGGTLAESFRKSCNTTFALLGLQMGEQFVPAMRAFGINRVAPLDLQPGSVLSLGPQAGTFEQNKPSFALAGIGQGEVATTPLEMALVASAIANGGQIMAPHVATEIRDSDGKVVRTIDPKRWLTATNPATAATLKDFMVSVVQSGTGTAARIPGVTVAGKTGTAQAPGGPPHAWFIAFAPAEAPRFAISVIVERGGSLGDEATGGRIAAPIAAKVLQYLLTHS